MRGHAYARDLAARFSSYGDFYRFCCGDKGAGELAAFGASRREWVSQHLSSPDRFRLTSKKAVCEAAKSLDVVKTTGGRWTAPKKQFVSITAWNEKKHGALTSHQIVSEMVFGKATQGFWMYAPGHEQGIFEYEVFDEAAVRDTSTEASGSGELAAAAVRNKRSVLMGAFDAVEAKRDAVTPQALGSSASDVLAMISDLLVSAPPMRAPAGDPLGQAAVSEAAILEVDSDEEGCPDDRARLQAHFGHGPQSAFAPAKGKAGAAFLRAGQASRGGGVTQRPAGAAPAGGGSLQKSGPATVELPAASRGLGRRSRTSSACLAAGPSEPQDQRPSSETPGAGEESSAKRPAGGSGVLDGRFLRLQKALDEGAAKVCADLSLIKFEEAEERGLLGAPGG